MNKKILTIIIPSYNIEQFIEKTISSLIVKQIDLLDIVIVNDGSTDSTLLLAKKYERKYPNSIRVVNKQNGNYGSCVNEGIKVGVGKYVKILDGDDYFDNVEFSDYISTLSTLDDNSDIDIVITNYQEVDPQGNIISVCKINEESNRIIPVSELKCINQLQHHFVTYNFKKIKELGYQQTTGISYTDQEWISIPLFSMKNAYYLDSNPLYCYLIGRDGQTMEIKTMIKKAENMVQVLESIITQYQQYKSEYPVNGQCVLERIDSFSRLVYSFYIMKHFKEVDFQPLIQFDKWLKENNKDFYNRFGNQKYSKKIPIRYVNLWRNSNPLISLFRIFTQL